jgi:hypothetical protein
MDEVLKRSTTENHDEFKTSSGVQKTFKLK